MQITTHVQLPIDRLPGKLSIEPNRKWDKEIVYFYSNYRYWILDYAETLINGKGIKQFSEPEKFVNDAGYAFLAIVNGYFELIGQLCGSDGDKYDCYRQWNRNKGKGKYQKATSHPFDNWNNWDRNQKNPSNKILRPQSDRCIWYGLAVVFESDLTANKWKPKTSLNWAKFCHSFYSNTRNSIAHTTFPNKLLITRDNSPVFWFENIKRRKILSINLPLWYERIAQHFDQYILRIRYPQNIEDKVLRKKFLKRYKKLSH
jgi:hypothetical protein